MAHRLPRPTPQNLKDILKLRRGHHQLSRLCREAEDARDYKLIDQVFEVAEELMQDEGNWATFGAEAIRGAWQNNYFGDTVALYVNTGDAYTGTLLYDVGQDKFYVGTYGDWVEDYENRTGQTLP